MTMQRISNAVVQIADIVPITGASTYNTEYVDMSTQLEILAKIHCGVVGTSVSNV